MLEHAEIKQTFVDSIVWVFWTFLLIISALPEDYRIAEQVNVISFLRFFIFTIFLCCIFRKPIFTWSSYLEFIYNLIYN